MDVKTLKALLKLTGHSIKCKCGGLTIHTKFHIKYDGVWAINKCMRCGVEDKNPIESIFLKIKGRFFKKYLSLNLL